MAIIVKDDEVLDWQEMLARYKRVHVVLLERGDHALSNFAPHISPVLRFLNLALR